MISRDKEKSNTLFFNVTFFLQFPEGINQYINPFITEFISAAVYHQNTIF